MPGQRLARGGCGTKAAGVGLQRGGGSKNWHGSCLHPYGLLRRTSEVDIQVSRLPWYPPDLQQHALTHSSNTDIPKAKGLPVLSPRLCTRTLLSAYPLAFRARQLRRTPWHCWPSSLLAQKHSNTTGSGSKS